MFKSTTVMLSELLQALGTLGIMLRSRSSLNQSSPQSTLNFGPSDTPLPQQTWWAWLRNPVLIPRSSSVLDVCFFLLFRYFCMRHVLYLSYMVISHIPRSLLNEEGISFALHLFPTRDHALCDGSRMPVTPTSAVDEQRGGGKSFAPHNTKPCKYRNMSSLG